MTFKTVSANCLLAASLLLTACGDPTPKPVVIGEGGRAGNSEPSEHTVQANQAVLEQLPFADERDFSEAQRGLVARFDNLVVKHQRSGDVIWDMPAYDFLEGEAPATVNPSLWRQAKLNNTPGLYQVKEGIWQLRNFDLSTLSIIAGKKGWILVDPGITRENAEVAMAFLKEHLLGDKPITAVLFTHSHVDHFGGILGYITKEQHRSGQVTVYAPEGFIEEAASENILLSTAMMRRAGYQYGQVLAPGPYGDVDLGLGKSVPFGSSDLLVPDVIVKETGEEHLIDGVRFIFQIASGTEAPAEFTFYLPEHRAFCGAEVISRTLHNVYTLRGAKVRDALKWSEVIDSILQNYGEAEVIFNSHHWPIWGSERIAEYLGNQRDTYKFIHDQSVRMVLNGMTPNEIANSIALPDSLQTLFSNRGYYGTVQHNAKAVYQFYMGWYDGNPANLHPLPAADSARRYMDMMGGVDSVVDQARSYYENGEYQWVAELLNHAVFAHPEHGDAKELLAKTYDQMGYQAESGPWRSEYLTAAHELRHGITVEPKDTRDAIGMLEMTPMAEFLKTFAVMVDPDKAAGKYLRINLQLTDTGELFELVLENSVLHSYQRQQLGEANATLILSKRLFLDIITGAASLSDLLLGDELALEGGKLDLLSFFSVVSGPLENFPIVTP